MLTSKPSAKDYIQKFDMIAHQEGGFFSVAYASNDKVKPLAERYQALENEKKIERRAGSAIYYLLSNTDFSAWHRLKSDEIWHYYDGGSPIDIHIIDQNGQLRTHILGRPQMTENAAFQVAINANNWFAAELRDKSSFALAGCSVCPGFEYNDFELANSSHLCNKYPEHKTIIERLSRGV